MVKPIIHDILFLSKKSEPATVLDAQVIRDLQDTLKANEDRCVGMAANMIGVSKCILGCMAGPMMLTMVNPRILSREGAYQTEEGCLCHEGERPARRYQKIRVAYLDEHFQPQERLFMGYPAQIIQHEMDHFQGTII